MTDVVVHSVWNDNVFVNDQQTWGKVKCEANTPRSYIVKTNSGAVRINRRHLVKAELNDDKNSNDDKPRDIDIELSSDLPQSADPPKQTDTQTHYITRSDRVSKPPEKLDL